MARLGARQLPRGLVDDLRRHPVDPPQLGQAQREAAHQVDHLRDAVRRGGDPLDGLGREGMGAAPHGPPAEVDIPADTVGVERRQTEAGRFASRRAAEPQRVELRLEQGLAHQQDPEIGPHDEDRIEGDEQVARQGLRLVEAHDDAVSGFGGSQAVPQVVEAQRETLDHRVPSRALELGREPSQQRGLPGARGPVRTASRGASFSRVAIRR